jgi:hypothetical protein
MSQDPRGEPGNTEYQGSIVGLGAIAGDEAVTIGIVNSRAGVFQSWSPALAPKHLVRAQIEH